VADRPVHLGDRKPGDGDSRGHRPEAVTSGRVPNSIVERTIAGQKHQTAPP
jgi:hypothetical protein